METLLKNLLLSTTLAGAALTSVAAQAATDNSAINKIQETGELRVCFEAGYVPFEMKAKNGQFIGFDIDIAKHMARSMKVEFVPVNTAWDGIIPALQTGKCEVIIGGMTVTPLRNLQVLFSDPYLEIGQTVLLSPKLKEVVKSYRDLNNPKYTISSQLGTTGAEAAKKYLPKATLNLFETSADAALQVKNGKADAFVYDLPYNAIYAAEHKESVFHLNTPFTYEPLGWAVRHDSVTFVNFLNNYLKRIKGDGTYQRIYSKWFESHTWMKNIQ